MQDQPFVDLYLVDYFFLLNMVEVHAPQLITRWYNKAYKRNDIVMVDNHRIGHGREIYLGPKTSRVTLDRFSLNPGYPLYSIRTLSWIFVNTFLFIFKYIYYRGHIHYIDPFYHIFYLPLLAYFALGICKSFKCCNLILVFHDSWIS